MHPVPRMQLVDLDLRGIATWATTLEAAKGFVAWVGKTATMSEDFPAYIVNRFPLADDQRGGLTSPYEGVGSVEATMTRCGSAPTI